MNRTVKKTVNKTAKRTVKKRKGEGGRTNVEGVGTRLDVVVADDDQHDQLLLTMAAEQANVEVDLTFVDDGAQLLALLDRRAGDDHLPDLIVLDLRMPRLDGHQVLQLLNEDPGLWRIPVVVLSSSSDRADIDATYTRGVRAYETKPSDFAELKRFVSSLTTFGTTPPPNDSDESDGGLVVSELLFGHGPMAVVSWQRH